MINLIMVKEAANHARKLSGAALILAAVAGSAPVFATPAATSATTSIATSAAGSTTAAPAGSAQTTNDAGATSGGGSFFTPPDQVKEGSMTADQALKSTEVPEPGMIALFGGATIMTLAVARRRRRK